MFVLFFEYSVLPLDKYVIIIRLKIFRLRNINSVFGGKQIRKNNPGYRAWIRRRLLKLERRRISRKKKTKNTSQGQTKDRRRRAYSREQFDAPEKLSIIDYPEETLEFFNHILEFVKKKQNQCTNTELYLNFKNVKYLTIDAIMYLVTIIKKLRSPMCRCRICGNFPEDPKSNRLMVESGFIKFVESYVRAIKPRKEYIQIREGQNVSVKIAKEVCDFTVNAAGCGKNAIYTVLVELMANAWNHAYDSKENVVRMDKWYIFVEETEEKVCYTFLDTGYGIPNTVYKKISERALDTLPILQNTDLYYIKSALSGQSLRTQTRQENRGMGLPRINKLYLEGKIENLKIISGKGYYGDESIQKELNHGYKGTLAYWEISKEKRRMYE